MIISIPCPSAPHPIGGVTALYDFANALARRGHTVHLVHADYFGCRIESLADLSWFPFEASLHHHIVQGEDLLTATPVVPRADVVFATGLPRELGLPVHLVQGFEMLHPWIEREAFRAPSLKVCIARWLVEVGEFFGVPREEFRVVPMGIDHQVFRPPASDERPYDVAILHSAHPAKGWTVGRAALDLVREDRPDLRVVAFGTATPTEDLPDWITFLEAPVAEVLARDVYGASRVFVQASNYEGFGFTAVEAMACGAALVTTDNGGSRDYAVPGETALVVDPGDVPGMAQAIAALLDDDHHRHAITLAGTAFVRRFDWDRGARLLEGCLEEYLADPGPFLQDPGPDRSEGVPQGELAAEVLAWLGDHTTARP